MVSAIAAPTPTGAKYMTIFVNLNIVSDKLLHRISNGWRLSWRMSAKATAKMMLKTTTCSTCPSAIDFAMFSGKMWRIMSLAVGLVAGAASCPVGELANFAPTPA